MMAFARRLPERQPRLQADRPLELSGCHLGGAAPAEPPTGQPTNAGAPADYPKLEFAVPCYAEPYRSGRTRPGGPAWNGDVIALLPEVVLLAVVGPRNLEMLIIVMPIAQE